MNDMAMAERSSPAAFASEPRVVTGGSMRRKEGALAGATKRRVFLTDDHPIVRQGLTHLFNREGTRQIAERLRLSVKTVDTYQAHIKEKMSFSRARQLIQYAIQWVIAEKDHPSSAP